MQLLTLSQHEIEQLLLPHELLAALEEGFKALSAGQLNVPSRNQVTAPKGILLGMPAYMPKYRMSVKLVSVFHENHKLNLPGHQALITLFDSETGTPLALMDGTFITAMRTAAGAILSINLLARENIKRIAIIGAGVQGQSHLKMIESLAGIEEILIASKTFSHAQALGALDSRARAVDSVQEAVRHADAVCLCTASPDPVIEAEWLKEGTHISSVGYRPPGGELPRSVIEKGSLFVETRRAFEAPPVGSAELQGLDPEFGTEIGEVLLKQKPGRRSETEITIYKSMGHAMQDLLAANLVYEKAIARKMGRMIEL
jgi:ornithine cyclodeaminase/alanine dehydrogenase-like protein (mu-crystallin family)